MTGGATVSDPQALRAAFGCFPSGLAALCALIGGTPTGMAVSSFTSVSLDPPLVSAYMQDSSTTWPRLRQAPRLGISVLSERHARAGRSLAAKTGDRFTGVRWRAQPHGAVVIEEAAAWFDCSVFNEVPAGDHTLVLFLVHAFEAGCERPLVFHGSQFRRLHTDDLDG
jgi:flavin reductase (DIM6/NTAB) family NADH-FMN oxidoreductase RutF